MNYALGAEDILGASDDELLAEILSGDDDLSLALGAEEILGAGMPAKALPPAVKQALARRAVAVRNRQFTKRRTFLLGLNSLAVGAGLNFQINARPQYPFTTTRFLIPATFAPNFVINQINIGQQPVLVAAGAIPAEAFTEVAVGVQTIWDTAAIGNEVTVDATSIAAAAADFRSVMFGTAVKD